MKLFIILKTNALLTFGTLLFLLACSSRHEVAPPAALLPVPSERQLAWHEMEQYAFVHFTTNTFTGKEWGYGDESPQIFNPTSLDVEQWVGTIKKAGLKALILTCKHHDGFCLWPSAYTEHSIKNSPYKNGQGNLVKEVSEACKKQGLKFGIYLSPWDRNRADYGQGSYVDYYRNQLKELFNNYGPAFEMWFDGANGGDGYYGGAREKRHIDSQTYYQWPTTLAMVRNLEPQVIMFSDAGPDIRWCGNEQGLAGETNWNTISSDTLYAGKPNISALLNQGSENGNRWIPAEVDVSIRPGWFYHAQEDSDVKTPDQLFDIYLQSVGRGSNLLLNIPPDRRGLIHEKDVASLLAWKKKLDEAFGRNLAGRAKATASTYRGNAATYAASNATDENPATYWATDDAVTNGTLDIELAERSPIHYVVLQEYIRLGQRVKSFEVEAWQNGAWKQVAQGSTIGYKRILKVNTSTSKLRLIITNAKACPLIANLAVY